MVYSRLFSRIPRWDAWIEMGGRCGFHIHVNVASRVGMRGLKFIQDHTHFFIKRRIPRWDAWIEIKSPAK